MAEKFEEGDVVKLKAGGPKMVVQWCEHDDVRDQVMALCDWFENGIHKSAQFAAGQLEKAE